MTTPAPDHILDFAVTALDHAIFSISKGGPLIPFTIVRHLKEDKMKRFVSELLEESVAAAKAELTSAMQYAEIGLVAYDGFLTVENVRTDAIFTLTYEQGSPQGHILVRRYKPKLFGGTKPIGNPVYLGTQ